MIFSCFQSNIRKATFTHVTGPFEPIHTHAVEGSLSISTCSISMTVVCIVITFVHILTAPPVTMVTLVTLTGVRAWIVSALCILITYTASISTFIDICTVLPISTVTWNIREYT